MVPPFYSFKEAAKVCGLGFSMTVCGIRGKYTISVFTRYGKNSILTLTTS